MNFAELIAAASLREDGLALAVPDTWHQGRTAYGGLSAAVCLAVAKALGAKALGGEGLPPLRSAQFAMIAPVNGEIEVAAAVIRRGRNATWMSAQILCGGALAFTASFVFMGPVESGLHINERPVPAGLTAALDARAVTYTQRTPAFLRNHFESRHAVPPSGEKQPEMCRWVRLAERDGLDPMVELILLADALPPGVMPMLSPGVPVSTMHWQVNLLTPAPVTDDGWFLLRAVGDYAEKGCSSQRMAIWNTASRPIMAGMQSVALFG